MDLSPAVLQTLFDELIAQQLAKVLKLAKFYYPDITPEDVRNPQDFPKLMADANFHFEDGILSGYLAAKIAVLAKLK